ncbi:hypothetical protein TNCV_4070611 [Trichonephila clavipes]|nr:hypothetical protein TNCV_4070611 [Trichonephila clavipes]
MISGVHGNSRYVFGNRNTLRRTGTRLQRRHCATTVSSLVIQSTIVAISLCGELSWEAEVMATLLLVHTAANVVASYERLLGILQTCRFSLGP